MRFNAPALLSNNIQSTSHFENRPTEKTNDVMRDLRLKYASSEINLIPKALTFLVWDKTRGCSTFCRSKQGQYTRPFLCLIFLEVTALTVWDRWSSTVISPPPKETFVSYYTEEVFMFWWTTVSPVRTHSCFLCHLYGCTNAASFRNHCSYIVVVK